MGLTARSTVSLSFPESPAPSQSPELAAIASYVRAGRCALFVGAGLSVGAGLPTWNGLMRRVIAAATPAAVDRHVFADDLSTLTLVDNVREARRDPLVKSVEKLIGVAAFRKLLSRHVDASKKRPDASAYLDALAEVRHDAFERAELERLLSAGRNQEVAARCRDLLGRDRFIATVGAALRAGSEIPATHQDVVRTPYACVVTTNFDDLLECAYERFCGARPPAPTGAELDRHGDLLLRGAFFVLKAHGDLGTPDSLVFTADDYRRVVHANPAFQAVISGILMTHAIVFVGYSLSDVNFRLLLDGQLTTFRGRVPPRFAVMGGVGPAERATLWRTARLRVLPYPEGKHEEVAAFLRSLANATAHRPPMQRPASGARAASARPGSVLHPQRVLTIASDGERIEFDLREQEPSGASSALWTGAATWSGFGALRDRVKDTFQTAETLAEWNARIERAGAALSEIVPAELRRILASYPVGWPLDLLASASTEPVPWEWVRVGATALGMRLAIVRRPVGYSPGARGRRRLADPPHALIIGDAGSADGRRDFPLPMADLEASHAARALAQAPVAAVVTLLSGKEATADRLLEELAGGDYDLVHFAGHAWAGPEDAYIYMWDRLVLGTELAPLLSRRPPALLVMSTHHTAFFPLDLDRDALITPGQLAAPERHGEPVEDRGFTALAMRCGVASFVGCCGSVSDAGSARVMSAFYDRLVLGDSTPEALRAARRLAFDEGDATGLQFVAIGDPDFRLLGAGRHDIREKPPKPSRRGKAGRSSRRNRPLR